MTVSKYVVQFIFVFSLAFFVGFYVNHFTGNFWHAWAMAAVTALIGHIVLDHFMRN